MEQCAHLCVFLCSSTCVRKSLLWSSLSSSSGKISRVKSSCCTHTARQATSMHIDDTLRVVAMGQASLLEREKG